MSRSIFSGRAQRGGRRGHSSAAAMLESLEPRIVFDAPHEFAGVGIRYDGGPRLFFVEGVVDANDQITGDMQFADATGLLSTDPIDWTSLTRQPDGSMTFGTRNGFTPYDSQTGTNFIIEDRWFRGSFVGRDAQGRTRDFAVLGELEQSFLTPYFRADISLTRITQGGALETNTLTIEQSPNAAPGTLYRLTFQLPGGDTFVDVEPSFNADGSVGFGAYGTMIVPHRAGSQASVFFRDFDATDGTVAIGAGRIGGDAFQGDAGRFRGAVLVNGELGAAFFGVDPQSFAPGHPEAANVVIEMNFWRGLADVGPASTFRIFRQSDWDADPATATPITEGTWVYERSDNNLVFIRMTDESGREVVMRSSGPRTLLPVSITDGNATESLQGLAQALVYRAGRPDAVMAGVDPQGNPIAYMQFYDGENSNVYYSIDLVSEVGGEAVVGEIYTWATTSYSTHDVYIAGRSASGDVLVWRLMSDGVSWSFINLTQSMGADSIVSDLFATRSETSIYPGAPRPTTPVFAQALAGFDAQGDLVVFRWSDAFDLEAGSIWTLTDTGDTGIDGGVLPNVVGGLAGWGAPWGATHFAGVDSSGELWAIWWAPGLDRWRVDSLTASSGGPLLAPARPAAVETKWDAFHISAVDTNGHLVVTWWAPGLSNWVSTDLTTELSGPTLDPGSLATDFNRFRENLNIVGRDADGRARIYWWNQYSGWNIGDLTAGTPLNDAPLTPWTMTHARWFTNSITSDSQSLLGVNQDGDIVRLVWFSEEPDAWVLQNLTDVSTPYLV